MATYAVHMRIEGVRPTRPGRAARWSRSVATVPAPEIAIEQAPTPVDLVGRPLGEIVAERWMRIREACSQTTFFLFDPDSWR
jgi:hypothetical protein